MLLEPGTVFEGIPLPCDTGSRKIEVLLSKNRHFAKNPETPASNLCWNSLGIMDVSLLEIRHAIFDEWDYNRWLLAI